MNKPHVAVIVGSNRRESINRRLAEALVGLIGDRAGTSFVRIDDLPMYNADLEAERPDAVTRFTREVKAADAVLIVMPGKRQFQPPIQGMTHARRLCADLWLLLAWLSRLKRPR